MQTKKVDLHTDFLTGRNVVLALASDKVDAPTKMAVIEKMKTFDAEDDIEMGKPIIPRIYDDSQLADFVDEGSWCIFKVNM